MYMNMYMYVCMYMYMYMYMYLYMYMYMYTYMYMQIYICTFPPKNREIALWPNVRVLKCEYKFHKGQTYLVQ